MAADKNESVIRQDESSGECALVFTGLSVRRGSVSVLENVTAHVPRRGCTAIVGPNGAGKTTLLLALLGEVPYRGTLSMAGTPRIGYVPQHLSFDRGMPLTVMEFMAMGLQRRPLWLGVKAEVRTEIHSLLENVHAAHLTKRRLGALSGGETQRVLLALALEQNPDLLVLDEPAAGVDPRGDQLFCELLDDLRDKKGFTQLMVTHDLGMVTHHATHVICLNRTVVAEGAPGAVLTGQTLMELFGMHMGVLDSRAMPVPACDCCEGGQTSELS